MAKWVLYFEIFTVIVHIPNFSVIYSAFSKLVRNFSRLNPGAILNEILPVDPNLNGIVPVLVDPNFRGIAPVPVDPNLHGIAPVPVDPNLNGVAPASADPNLNGIAPVPVDPNLNGIAPVDSSVRNFTISALVSKFCEKRKVSRFLRRIVKKVFPIEIFGNEKNLEIFLNFLDKILAMNRYF